MTRIALFGGSFNPIHLGHLWMAQAMLDTLNVDEVLFMPTGDSPHKGEMLDASHRADMVELACEAQAGFSCSRLEADREAVSYTIRTVEHLLETNDGAKIDLLIGLDSFLQFHTWKEYEKLLKLVKLVVVPRVTEIDLPITEQLKRLQEKGAKVHFLPMPVIEISSTGIRDRVRNGRTIQNLVPDAVREYILKHGLYEDAAWKGMRERLKQNLSKGRYEHSLRVSEFAVKLARAHRVNEEKAEIAGLLHDCAKGKEEEVLKDPQIAKAFSHTHEPNTLWHTYLGPIVAASEYEVLDPVTLRAMRSHTTAAHPMSDLDKIVYIADKVEPGRHDPDNVFFRKLALHDLDEAFYAVMQSSIEYLEERGLPVHEETKKVWKIMNEESRS